MKVVLLGHLHGFGGAEKSLVFLANELSKRGNQVSLLSFTSDNNIYDLNSSVKYCFIPDHGKRKIDVLRNRFLDLAKKTKELTPAVVVSFWFQLAVFAVLISKTQGFKVIYSERGDPKDIEYNGINGIIRYIIFPLMDGFVFQTKGAQDFFSKKVVRKSCVIHNAITIPEEIILEDIKKEKIIAAVGRYHRQKNFPLMIKAFAKVHNLYPEYKLIVYGDGELRTELEELIDKLGLTSSVLLYGNTRDILRRMKRAEMFALSSDFEGMPNVLMEAMGLGLPCVSTDCSPGGASELIQNNVNGLIVPIKDISALAEAMVYIIEHPHEANRMGKRATEILQTHSPQLIYDKWNSYIEGVTNGVKKRVY